MVAGIIKHSVVLFLRDAHGTQTAVEGVFDLQLTFFRNEYKCETWRKNQGNASDNYIVFLKITLKTMGMTDRDYVKLIVNKEVLSCKQNVLGKNHGQRIGNFVKGHIDKLNFDILFILILHYDILQGWPSSLIVQAIFQNLKFFRSCNLIRI